MTFGQKLKYIREELLHISQLEMAKSLDVTATTINSLESGKNKNASFVFFQRLVTVYNINPMYFLKNDITEPAILIQDGRGNKPLLQKIAKYEKHIAAMAKLMAGKENELTKS